MITLLLGAAMAQSPDFRSHLDQAKFFVRRGWADDALAELERAAATEDGRIDPDVWWLLAQVRLELGDLAGAEDAAEKAHSYARTDEQVHAASALASFLREAFGTLRVDSSPGGLSSTLEVARSEPLVDPAVAAYFARLTASLSGEGSQLPRDIELPIGAYALNGVPAEITAHETTEVILLPDQIRAPHKTASQLLRVDGAIGLHSWLELADSHGIVGPQIELGLRQLTGPVVLGGSVTWTPQPHARRDVAPVYGIGAGSISARIGAPLPSPFGVFTPAIGYRLAVVPGVELSCASPDWSCTEADTADLWIYANALVHAPFVELGLEFGDALRKTRWSPGVRAVGELGFAQLPSGGTSRLVSGGEFMYTVDAATRSRTSPGLTLALTLSHGL